MRILVTGAESSGTSLVTALLGSEAVHRSVPAGTEWLLPDGPWDAIVVCHRHGPLVARSQERYGHADTVAEAFEKQARGYALVYAYAQLSGCRVVQCSYEALVYEQEDALGALFDALGLPRSEPRVEIGNANAKWHGGPVFSDHRGAERMLDGAA